MSDLIEMLRSTNDEIDIAAADRIERLEDDLAIALENYKTQMEVHYKDRDRIKRLRAHIEWIAANTDSASTALYCHAALEDCDVE